MTCPNSQHRSFLVPEQVPIKFKRALPIDRNGGRGSNVCHLVVEIGPMDDNAGF